MHPILNTLYEEASERPQHFKKRAVRALILYPMNALVSDQMTRLRRLFGDERVKEIFNDAASRNVQFGMYTSRTPYAGAHSATKDRYQLNDILNYYTKLEETMPAKVEQMKERGKWPAKDLQSFKNSKKIIGIVIVDFLQMQSYFHVTKCKIHHQIYLSQTIRC